MKITAVNKMLLGVAFISCFGCILSAKSAELDFLDKLDGMVIGEHKSEDILKNVNIEELLHQDSEIKKIIISAKKEEKKEEPQKVNTENVVAMATAETQSDHLIMKISENTAAPPKPNTVIESEVKAERKNSIEDLKRRVLSSSLASPLKSKKVISKKDLLDEEQELKRMKKRISTMQNNQRRVLHSSQVLSASDFNKWHK